MAKDVEENRPKNGYSRRTEILLQQQPSSLTVHLDPMQVIFRRGIAALLATKGISCDSKAFEYVSLLAEEYMVDLFSQIHGFSSVQRRSCPAVVDVAHVMRERHIQIVDLEKHMGLKSKYIDAFSNLQFDATEEPMTEEAKLFFEQSNPAKSLIPQRKKRGPHVLDWLPAYPPDHTFMATPQYTERITDPRQLREKIVEEGRLAEEALRRLTGVINVSAADEEEEEDDEHKENDNDKEIQFAETRAVSEEPMDEEERPVVTLDDDRKEPKPTPDVPDGDEDSGPISLASLSKDSPKPQGLESTATSATPPAPDTTPAEPPKKLPKLRLSFGKSKVIKSEPESKPEPSPQPKSELFEIKSNGKFDVLECIEKRKQVLTNRRKREEERQQLLEQQALQPRHPCQSIIDNEYDAALASIQRTKDKEGDTNRVLDTGVVNWDRERYLS